MNDLCVEEQLDQACDRFEAAWQGSPTPNIADFLGEAPAEWRRLILPHLIMLDLEYQWRNSTTRAARLEEYTADFPELGPLEQLPLTMIGEEYRIRLRWGDQPQAGEYFERFASRNEEVASALDLVLQAMWPTWLRIYEQGAMVLETPLTAVTEIGRQRRQEPPAPCVVDAAFDSAIDSECNSLVDGAKEEASNHEVASSSGFPCGRRIVLAGRTQRMVSRRHLRLEIQADGSVLSINRSAKNAVVYEHGEPDSSQTIPTESASPQGVPSRGVLRPGEQSALTPPIVLAVADKLIRLSQTG